MSVNFDVVSLKEVDENQQAAVRLLVDAFNSAVELLNDDVDKSYNILMNFAAQAALMFMVEPAAVGEELKLMMEKLLTIIKESTESDLS